MYKEIIITTVIIILIIIGNIIIQNNTNKSAEAIIKELNIFKQNITKSNLKKEENINSIEKIMSLWKQKSEKMAYYIEHDELEKVETEITKLKANIEAEEYSFAIENIDTSIFIIEHIKDKTALKIVNIF